MVEKNCQNLTEMKYQLLPFRFARFNEEEYLLSNDVGEYIFLKNDDFHKFVN